MKAVRSELLSAGTLWFGAAVTIAEIAAGCELRGNWLALVLGHLVGGLLLFGVGYVGARERTGAMETVRGTFGCGSARFFALLNMCQLTGWTAVMISQGAAALAVLTEVPAGLWCVLLAGLIWGWMWFGLGDGSRVSVLCIAFLAILCAVLTGRLLLPDAARPVVAPTGFADAFELSVAMPLSWLPLISDYTCRARRPVVVAAVSAGVYALTSAWMFALGSLIAASGHAGLVEALTQTGPGFSGAGLVVIALSTMTSTFLDVTSSGCSAQVVWSRLSPRPVGTAVAVLGCAFAVWGIMDRYLGFLSLIASVFAPMATVLLVDRLRARRGGFRGNAVAWLAGVAAYHVSVMQCFYPSLTSVAVAALVALLANGFSRKRDL